MNFVVKVQSTDHLKSWVNFDIETDQIQFWTSPLELLLAMMRMWELRAGSWVLTIEDLLGERAMN